MVNKLFFSFIVVSLLIVVGFYIDDKPVKIQYKKIIENVTVYTDKMFQPREEVLYEEKQLLKHKVVLNG